MIFLDNLQKITKLHIPARMSNRNGNGWNYIETPIFTARIKKEDEEIFEIILKSTKNKEVIQFKNNSINIDNFKNMVLNFSEDLVFDFNDELAIQELKFYTKLFKENKVGLFISNGNLVLKFL